jgi:hypothetical protein
MNSLSSVSAVILPAYSSGCYCPSNWGHHRLLHIPAEHLLKLPNLSDLTHIRTKTLKPPNGFLRNLIWNVFRCIIEPFQFSFRLDNFGGQFTLDLTAFLLLWASYLWSVHAQICIPTMRILRSIFWPASKENTIWRILSLLLPINESLVFQIVQRYNWDWYSLE